MAGRGKTGGNGAKGLAGGGFAGGIFWGGVIVVAGLVALSQFAPLPEGGQPLSANQNAAPVAETKLAEADQVAASAGVEGQADGQTGGQKQARTEGDTAPGAASSSVAPEALATDDDLTEVAPTEVVPTDAAPIEAAPIEAAPIETAPTNPDPANPDLTDAAPPPLAAAEGPGAPPAAPDASPKAATSDTPSDALGQNLPADPAVAEPALPLDTTAKGQTESTLATKPQPKPETAPPGAVATQAMAPEVKVLGAVAPDVGAPKTTAPEVKAPDVGAPDVGAPEAMAPDSVAPETAPPEAVAPDTMPPKTALPTTDSQSAEPKVQDAEPKVASAEPAPVPQAPTPEASIPEAPASLPPLPDTPATEAAAPSLSALDEALTAPDGGEAPVPEALGVTEAPDAPGAGGLSKPGAQLSEPARLPQISAEPDPSLAPQPLPQRQPQPLPQRQPLAPPPAAPGAQPPQNAEVANPDAQNPDAPNPDAPNPVAPNPDAPNPDAQNPDNPNPDSQNPDASNPGILNRGGLKSDASGLPGQKVAALPQSPEISAKPATPKPEGDPAVVTGELPQIGTQTEIAASMPAEERPLVKYARPFEGAGGKPLFAVLLRDVGDQGLPRDQVAKLPFPVSIVIDPLAPDAKEAAVAWRAAGQEVVMLANGLPQGATPGDVAQSFQAIGAILPEAVAVMDPSEAGFQGNRALATLVLSEVASEGRGLLTWDRGLNAADQIARRDGVPAGLIYRVLDGDGESQPVMRRYLDRAAFKAGQEGSVIVFGDTRPDTVEALLGWALEGKGASVALAPVSAVLVGAGGGGGSAD